MQIVVSSGKIAIIGDSDDPAKYDYVGQLSGSTRKDFYVYEWVIKETGEVFYIGKGCDDRYREPHNNDAERVKERYETENRFIATDLTEEEALILETKEIRRILNETDYCLTNRNVPNDTKRRVGEYPAADTPALQFETAPTIYVSETEQHYFGMTALRFDTPTDFNQLNHVFIFSMNVEAEEKETVYGGNYSQYYNEVMERLSNSHIMSNRNVKSVSAWISDRRSSVL